MGSIQNTKLQSRTQTQKPTSMKLLSYGLLAVLAFSAWADNRTKRPGTKLNRNRPNGQGQGRLVGQGKRRKPFSGKRQGPQVKLSRPLTKRGEAKRKQVRSGRLGQINTGKRQRNLIRGRKDGKPQRPGRNKATRKDKEGKRRAARNGQGRNGRKLQKNGRTGQGYYQNDYYYYYDDPSQGAANPAATGFYYPDDYVNYPVVNAGSEDCVPANTRIEYWDKPDEAMRAITGLTEEDAALLLKDVRALTYGNTGKFLMRNGGTVSYTSKSHSLIVNELCQGTGGTDYPYPYPTYSPGDYDNEAHAPATGYYPYDYGAYDYSGRKGPKKARNGPKRGGKRGGRKMANKKKD